MDRAKQQAEACQEHLGRFFHRYRDASLAKSANKTLRFLIASDVSLAGKPAGWAAGIVYALANRGRRACGVPGLLNAEVEGFFDVSMGTIRKRAAQVMSVLEI